ncbi:MAG: hypothetical protein P8N09_04480, partial [Planctomycetota bacterium]|nr:hypothetical protein [Planctomycetota bacterium]
MSRRLDNPRIAHPSARRVVCLASCLLSFLVLVTLPGCASSSSAKQSGTTNAPPWVDDAYAGTNRMVMLAAVGVAPGIGRAAEDAARRSAMRRVNEDILSSVRSELTTLSAQFASSDESTRWEQDMLEQIQIESEGDLPGAEVNDRWIDPSANATYVRVTVDRELLVRMLLDPVEESQLKAQGLLDGQQEASADAAQELLITLKAYALVAQTFTDALRANSAARSGSQSSRATPNVARAQQLYARSRTMLDQLAEQVARTAPLMQITVVQGDAQRGDPWERLDNALEGRVTLEIDGARQPMAQLPMRFRAPLPEGARAPTLVQSSATTNADGVIRCEVSELAAGQQGEGKIVL